MAILTWRPTACAWLIGLSKVVSTVRTTAWPPNRVILGTSAYKGMDLDLNGRNEEDGQPTIAAINSRSDHPCGVNTLMGDGSVRFFKNSVNGMVGRCLGTLAWGELRSAESYEGDMRALSSGRERPARGRWRYL